MLPCIFTADKPTPNSPNLPLTQPFCFKRSLPM